MKFLLLLLLLLLFRTLVIVSLIQWLLCLQAHHFFSINAASDFLFTFLQDLCLISGRKIATCSIQYLIHRNWMRMKLFPLNVIHIWTKSQLISNPRDFTHFFSDPNSDLIKFTRISKGLFFPRNSLRFSCYKVFPFALRYQMAKFQLLSTENKRKKMDSSSKKIFIAALTIICFSLTAITLFLVCLWIFHRKKESQELTNQDDDDDSSSEDAKVGVALSPCFARFSSFRTLSLNGFVSCIDYKSIEEGTDNFDQINILDECGEFGHVYKAILDNGIEAAVKKVNCSFQGIKREFENEVELLSRFGHPNIISFTGYCIENETGFIVYELMHNGSLETQLHGPSRGSELTWHRRLKIALDIARGLEYLHERCIPKVIHRCLTSSNILLDSNFDAKISDFAVALAAGREAQHSLKLSGATGYRAPEYVFHGILTDMSDVYAFGIILLELLLGRMPMEMLETTGRETLVSWARGLLIDGDVMKNIVDPVIRGTMSVKHLKQVATVAYLCVDEVPTYRPLATDILHALIPLIPEE